MVGAAWLSPVEVLCNRCQHALQILHHRAVLEANPTYAEFARNTLLPCKS